MLQSLQQSHDHFASANDDCHCLFRRCVLFRHRRIPTRYSYLAYHINKIGIDGGYPCNNNNSNGYDDNCLEVTLDTEYSMAMSNSFGAYQDTAMVWVYEGASFGDIYNVYNQMATDNYGRVSSTSWGCRSSPASAPR